MKESEKHHLKGKIVQMEIVLNLCANLEVVHEDHARRAWCAHVERPWWMNRESVTGMKTTKSTIFLKSKQKQRHA